MALSAIGKLTAPSETATLFPWLSGHEGVLAAVGASFESDEPTVVHGAVAVDQRGSHVLVAEHALHPENSIFVV